MTATESATERVAEHLRTGGPGAIAGLFAATVVLRHDPHHENDGPIDGALLASVSRAEVEAMGRALRGGAPTVVDLEADGRFLTMRSALRGELADGTAVDYRTEVVLEVDAGRIVGMEARLDPEAMEHHRRVLDAGGFRLPGSESAG